MIASWRAMFKNKRFSQGSDPKQDGPCGHCALPRRPRHQTHSGLWLPLAQRGQGHMLPAYPTLSNENFADFLFLIFDRPHRSNHELLPRHSPTRTKNHHDSGKGIELTEYLIHQSIIWFPVSPRLSKTFTIRPENNAGQTLEMSQT